MQRQTWAEKVEIMSKASGPEELESQEYGGFWAKAEGWCVLKQNIRIRLKPKEAPPYGTKCYMWATERPKFPAMEYSSGEIDDEGRLSFLDLDGAIFNAGYKNWEVIK